MCWLYPVDGSAANPAKRDQTDRQLKVPPPATSYPTLALIASRGGPRWRREAWHECSRPKDPEKGRARKQRRPYEVVRSFAFSRFRAEMNNACCRRAAFTRLIASNILFLLAAYLGKAALDIDAVLWTVVKILAVGATAGFVWGQYRGQWQAGKAIEVRKRLCSP